MAQTFAVAFVALAVAVLSVNAGFTFDTEKCKLSAETKTVVKECYHEVTKKEFDPATFKMEDVTTEEKVATAKCVAVKEGYLSADGQTVDLEKAKAAVDTMEADAAVKEALKTGFEACFQKGGDAITILTCNKLVHQTNCK